MIKFLAVIPARYASTRFPGKPLADIAGKTMIQRVYEQAKKCVVLNEVIVATDDQRIFDHVKEIGGKVMMTLAAHQSGTERCAEVAGQYPEFDIVINIQGDEPFIDPGQVEQLIQILKKNADIATLVKKITSRKEYNNPNVVKAVLNKRQEAMYFSRSPLPFYRSAAEGWKEAYKHIGLYGYKRAVLLELVNLAPMPLEQAEQLEQLRWLEHGYAIEAGETAIENISVDTPEDLKKIQKIKKG